MNSDVKKPFITGLIEGSIDAAVYQEILKTHAKETIAFPKYGNLSITTVDQKLIKRAQFTECEISPFRKFELDCDHEDEPFFDRMPSTVEFSKKKMKLSEIKKLLTCSFAPNHAGQRPYPSAGGLYPIEALVFLFNERVEDNTNIISGCYHFRPVSKKLQLIKKISMKYFFDELLHGFIDHQTLPNVAILYIAHIGKAIFKYRYRGYRHALMEVGSMYQQAIVVSQQMGLNNTVWSTFSDYKMIHALNLNPGTYMPITMQLLGYGKNI